MKRLVGAKRPGGKRPGGKRLGGETTRGGNGLGAKCPGFSEDTGNDLSFFLPYNGLGCQFARPCTYYPPACGSESTIG